MPLLSCGGKRPPGLGVGDGARGLAPCPDSPNCVSSDASEQAAHVEPLALAVPPGKAWPAIREEVERMPRTTLIEATPTYLHIECASTLFGFVDDLELHLRAADDTVGVRSASRVGRSDLGVNRRRVEALRAALQSRGIVR